LAEIDCRAAAAQRAQRPTRLFDSLSGQWQKYFMMRVVQTKTFARGITIVTRKDDVTGAGDIGLETTPEGLQYLKKLAQRKRMTLEAYARFILNAAMNPPPPARVCLDDLTQEEVAELMDEAIKRDGEFVIDATPLFDEIEAAEAATRDTKKRDE
jgi:hypothetical protein